MHCRTQAQLGYRPPPAQAHPKHAGKSMDQTKQVGMLQSQGSCKTQVPASTYRYEIVKGTQEVFCAIPALNPRFTEHRLPRQQPLSLPLQIALFARPRDGASHVDSESDGLPNTTRGSGLVQKRQRRERRGSQAWAGVAENCPSSPKYPLLRQVRAG